MLESIGVGAVSRAVRLPAGMALSKSSMIPVVSSLFPACPQSSVLGGHSTRSEFSVFPVPEVSFIYSLRTDKIEPKLELWEE